MPAPLVLVHHDQCFLDAACAALKASGFAVACFSNSLTALNALEAARTINLLITGIDFDPGQPNGVSLARVVRQKRPTMRTMFIGPPEAQPFVEDLGVLLSTPVDVDRLVEAVRVWHSGESK